MRSIKCCNWLAAMMLILLNQALFALTFELPEKDMTVIGSVKKEKTISGDTIVSIARRYDMGIMELIEANPTALSLNKSYGPQQEYLVPSQFILPNVPHQGMVINLAELRLYFYLPNTKKVITFPIGIGREDWDSPLGKTYIVRKKADPTWRPTQHILQARLADGVVLPTQVPPGPNNPLGPYALYTAIPTILIHGSNDPSGIGRRSSSACIRMQPEAIESIYHLVPTHLLVNIINEPIKLGWIKNDLYLEVHIPLENELIQNPEKFKSNMHQLVKAAIAKKAVVIDWRAADQAIEQHRGYPIKIATATMR